MKAYASLILLLAGSIASAHAASADDLKAAVKKLSDAGGYSWTSETDSAQGGRGFFGPTEGKVGKDGVVHVKMARGENSFEGLVHGSKAAIKTDTGWQSAEEASGDGGRGRGFRGRWIQNFKAPDQQVAELIDHVRNLKVTDGVYSGDLTEEGVNSLLGFRGGNFRASNPRGTVKFWVKDGVLTKYEYNVQGTVSFGGNDRDIDRTTTVEIKDIGSTTVEVPEEARKKLS